MILITGGLGHIGSATVQALLDIGEECVLVQRRSPEIPDGRFSAPVTAVQADVKDLEALRAIGRDHAITGIVHMAGSMPWPPNPDEAPVKAARRGTRWALQHHPGRPGVGSQARQPGQHDRRLRRPVQHRRPERGSAGTAHRPARHPDLQADQRAAGPSPGRGHRPGDHSPAHQRGVGTARAPPELRLSRARSSSTPQRRARRSTSPASAGGSKPMTASTSATSTTSAGRPHCCRRPTRSRTRPTTSAQAG